MIDLEYLEYDESNDDVADPALSKERQLLKQLTATKLGTYGEVLVQADLLRQGYNVFPALPGSMEDLCVTLEDKFFHGFKCLRIQVKTTYFKGKRKWRRELYSFSTSSDREVEKKVKLTGFHCDVVALVSADVKIIDYFPVEEITGMTTELYVSSTHDKRIIGQYPFERILDKYDLA